MEDVSFGFGEVVFVEEFAAHAQVGRTLRLVGRLVDYDPAAQVAMLANPDDDGERITVETSLLLQVKPFSADNIVALIGEVALNKRTKSLCFRPRVYAHTAPGMDFYLYKEVILKRRAVLAQQGFGLHT